MTIVYRITEPSSDKSQAMLQAIGWQVNMRSYSWSPPTDVYETETHLIIRVEVAGMRETDFSIHVDRNYLTISGTRMDVPERRAYHQIEIRFGEFATAIELPQGVDVDGTRAEYEDGFLMVFVPKSMSTKMTVD